MVQDAGGDARFVVENYGESELAKRFGVTRYPAIFVDDVLIATPNDFGFYGKGQQQAGGRYAPLQSAASHERFRADLARMIRLLLGGNAERARAQAAAADTAPVASLPAFTLRDLDGRSVTSADLAGRVVLVEFWATWCPPCRSTLAWLGELKRAHGDRLVVLAVAVESEEPEVRRVLEPLGKALRSALATPEMARAFGDVSSVPTLFLFDAQGRTRAAFYGAPPSLHAEAEAALAALLK